MPELSTMLAIPLTFATDLLPLGDHFVVGPKADWQLPVIADKKAAFLLPTRHRHCGPASIRAKADAEQKRVPALRLACSAWPGAQRP